MQRMLGAELTEHLGYEPGEAPPPSQATRRNGTSRKTMKGEDGALEIEVPRDREGSFEPRLIAKGQTRVDGLDESEAERETLQWSVSPPNDRPSHARGMSVRDIRGHLEDLYGLEVSPDPISRVTDAVLDEVKEWRSRALDAVYPVVIFDALRVKIRDKDSRIVRNKAVCLALGITGDGQREVLGLWIADNEGAEFWLSVMNELRNRGVQDILIAVVDGLKGFPEAINAAFPETTVQTVERMRSTVHLVRHSLNFCSWKDRKAVAAKLREVHGAESAEAARDALEAFDEERGRQYPSIAQAWRRSWEEAIPFFAFSPEPKVRAKQRDQKGHLHHERRGKPRPGDPQGDQDPRRSSGI
jgi:transposase-like protein